MKNESQTAMSNTKFRQVENEKILTKIKSGVGRP